MTEIQAYDRVLDLLRSAALSTLVHGPDQRAGFGLAIDIVEGLRTDARNREAT